MFTQTELKRLLRYDPETGVFTWLVSNRRVKVGDVAGRLCLREYRQIGINSTVYFTHRLAWFYMTGVWPADQIDHIDGCRANNKFSNLREATGSQNMHNSKKHSNNTSGFKGVSWYKRNKKWTAQIQVSNKQIHIGCYDDPQEAHAAYCAAAEAHHKEFARTA